MKAYLKNYRQSPRKVRLVAELIKGKRVEDAMVQLDFLAKRSASPIQKLLASAVANATAIGNNKENLFIKEIRVDKGLVMKRMMPRAMGRGARINKRTSHVLLVLGEKEAKTAKISKTKAEKVETVKEVKPRKAKVTKAKKETTAKAGQAE